MWVYAKSRGDLRTFVGTRPLYNAYIDATSQIEPQDGNSSPTGLVTRPPFSAEFHAWKAAGRSRVQKALSLTFLVLGRHSHD